jgi:hypothetical protein
MSSHSQLSLSWNDSDRAAGSLQVDQVVESARDFVHQQGWSEDVLEDLRSSCNSDLLGEPGFNGVMSYGIIEMIKSVSEAYPDTTFYAKGAGEEFGDLWLREFRAGVEQRRQGPFDDYAPPIPDELLAQAKAAYAAAMEKKTQSELPKKSGWLSKLLR